MSQASCYAPPTCKAHPISMLMHDHCATYAPPPTPPLYAIYHTILVMTISCKGQLVINSHMHPINNPAPARGPPRHRAQQFICIYMFTEPSPPAPPPRRTPASGLGRHPGGTFGPLWTWDERRVPLLFPGVQGSDLKDASLILCFYDQVNRSTGHTHTHRQRTTLPTPTHTHTTRTNPQTNTSHKHLKVLYSY